MILNHLSIENFRNFEKVEIDLTNRNIVFGLNDIGKSNFLCALRFLLDRNFRRGGFTDSDYYYKNTTKEIIITLKIDTSDENDDDNKKIFTMMKGTIPSDADFVYIQLKSVYDSQALIGEPNLYWGVELSELEEIPSSQSYFEVDKYFNVVYIDSSIQLENTFKRAEEKGLITREQYMKDGGRNRSFGDKIKQLKDYLPDFMVSNTIIYNVLSKGIHELDEETCKEIFPILQSCIELILDEEIAIQKKEALTKSAQQRLSEIGSKLKK